MNKNSNTDKNESFIFGVGIGSVISTVVLLAAITIYQNSNVLKLSDISRINTMTSYIERFYNDEYSEEDIIDGIYHGVAMNLDAYSDYMVVEDIDDIFDGDNDFCGIGVRTNYNAYNDIVKISKVYPDSPSEKAGILENDVLLKVDDEYVSNIKFSELSDKIRGEKGTTVNLTILRNEDEIEISVERDEVYLPDVEYQILNNDTGYLKLSSFNSSIESDVEKALTDLSSCNNLILDLRGNTGGVVNDMVKFMGMLFPDSLLCKIVYKNGIEEEINIQSGKSGVDFNFIVLCDKDTASCGEIVVQYFKDNDYTIVGEKTYGKGVSQELFPIKSGVDSFKLTTGKVYSPNGVFWNGVGITPDYELEYNKETDILKDNIVSFALELFEE